MQASTSPADLGRWLLGLLPASATAIAEGAWIAVVYGALQFGLSRGSGTVGLWAFVAVAAVAMFVVRVAPSGAAHYLAVATLVLGAAVAGWLSDPAVRTVVADGQLGGLITAGWGWLLGLAAWRGTRHRDPSTEDAVVAPLLTWIVPGLAVPWLIGSGSSERQAFVDAALPTTLLFVTAGLIAVGLARLETLGQLVGVDWRRNRAWVSMLVGVVGLVALIAVPTAWLLNASAEASTRTLLGPAVAVADAVAGMAAPVQDAIGGLLPGGSAGQPAYPPGGVPTSSLATWIDAFVLTGVLMVMVGVLLVFRRIMTSRPRPEQPPPEIEERYPIPPPPLPGGLGWIRLPRLGRRREIVPRTASEAYLVVLDRLEPDERLRRTPSESPAAHARRLRDMGAGTLSLDLLAADFELERYRGATLTPSEIRRAIERARAGARLGRASLKGAQG
ncbi:MAG TPA: DUF4129 domain-containing protein [Candidatus Limnocylindrales bacterium]